MSTLTYYCEDCDTRVEAYGYYAGRGEDGPEYVEVEMDTDTHDDHDLSGPVFA